VAVEKIVQEAYIRVQIKVLPEYIVPYPIKGTLSLFLAMVNTGPDPFIHPPKDKESAQALLLGLITYMDDGIHKVTMKCKSRFPQRHLDIIARLKVCGIVECLEQMVEVAKSPMTTTQYKDMIRGTLFPKVTLPEELLQIWEEAELKVNWVMANPSSDWKEWATLTHIRGKGSPSSNLWRCNQLKQALGLDAKHIVGIIITENEIAYHCNLIMTDAQAIWMEVEDTAAIAAAMVAKALTDRGTIFDPTYPTTGASNV
jgi:hypothetical protein